jgi:hypothetical protein
LVDLIKNEKNNPKTIEDKILAIINDQKPDTVRHLVYFATKQTGLPESIILTKIQEMDENKKINFSDLFFPQKFKEYLFSHRGAWYWIASIFMVISCLSIFLIPSNTPVLSYMRNFLGILFVLYLPGYSLIKTLYPIRLPLKMPSVSLDYIEGIVLSLGLSLALTSIVGLLLYYTPWGLTVAPVTVGLLIITSAFLSIGIFREYHELKSLFMRRITAVTKYELTDDALNFFEERGLINRRSLLVKTIPINEIADINSHDCELSITSNGGTNIFLMRSAQSSIDLRDCLRGIIIARSK